MPICKDCQMLRKEIERLKRDRATWQVLLKKLNDDNFRLNEAVEWALGERGDFAHQTGDEGTYWWRNELRKRAAKEG